MTGETEHAVLVMREGRHGVSMDRYAEAIRERVPNATVLRARTPAEERVGIERASVVTGHDIRPELLARAEHVSLFACASAGVGHLPLDRLRERGVTVTNASGVHGPALAEHVLFGLLLFARRLWPFSRRQRRREWRHSRGGLLEGSTVTVVGQGAVGRAIVDRLAPFGVDTLAVRHSPSKGGAADEVFGYDPDDVHDAFARTDYLVLACPLTETTRHLVDAAALATLPPRAVLTNVARGAVVDTDALVDALGRNRLRGAVLDVTDPEPLPPDHPLWRFENVFLTPHVGGCTPAYYERRADVLAANLARVAETGSFATVHNRVE